MIVQRATPSKTTVEDQTCNTCSGEFYGVALCRVTLGKRCMRDNRQLTADRLFLGISATAHTRKTSFERISERHEIAFKRMLEISRQFYRLHVLHVCEIATSWLSVHINAAVLCCPRAHCSIAQVCSIRWHCTRGSGSHEARRRREGRCWRVYASGPVQPVSDNSSSDVRLFSWGLPLIWCRAPGSALLLMFYDVKHFNRDPGPSFLRRLLAVLWLLQRPAPKVWTGVAAAPKWVRG